jgi:hypothetical protein
MKNTRFTERWISDGQMPNDKTARIEQDHKCSEGISLMPREPRVYVRLKSTPHELLKTVVSRAVLMGYSISAKQLECPLLQRRRLDRLLAHVSRKSVALHRHLFAANQT